MCPRVSAWSWDFSGFLQNKRSIRKLYLCYFAPHIHDPTKKRYLFRYKVFNMYKINLISFIDRYIYIRLNTELGLYVI